MKVGDLVRRKNHPKTIGLVVETFESSRQALTITILWAKKPWYVNLNNPHDSVEMASNLEVLNG